MRDSLRINAVGNDARPTNADLANRRLRHAAEQHFWTRDENKIFVAVARAQFANGRAQILARRHPNLKMVEILALGRLRSSFLLQPNLRLLNLTLNIAFGFDCWLIENKTKKHRSLSTLNDLCFLFSLTVKTPFGLASRQTSSIGKSVCESPHT